MALLICREDPQSSQDWVFIAAKDFESAAKFFNEKTGRTVKEDSWDHGSYSDDQTGSMVMTSTDAGYIAAGDILLFAQFMTSEQIADLALFLTEMWC